MNEEDSLYDKLLGRFKELKKEAEKDCKFELSNMDIGFNNTNLIIKWINKKSDWQGVYKSLESKRKKQYRSLYEFYCEDYPRKLNSKEEYQLFIESDESYNSIYQETLLCKEIIQYVDSVIETLKSRGYMLKNAIDWLKFKNGQ